MFSHCSECKPMTKEALKILKLTKKTKFYQASTSELYGKVQEIPQNELPAINSAFWGNFTTWS